MRENSGTQVKRALCVLGFFAADYFGCLISIAALVAPGVLPNPLNDRGYGLIAPVTLGISLAVTGTIFLVWFRALSPRILIAIAALQGLLAPITSIVLLLVQWEALVPQGVFIIPALLGSTIALVASYTAVNLATKLGSRHLGE